MPLYPGLLSIYYISSSAQDTETCLTREMLCHPIMMSTENTAGQSLYTMWGQEGYHRREGTGTRQDWKPVNIKKRGKGHSECRTEPE